MLRIGPCWPDAFWIWEPIRIGGLKLIWPRGLTHILRARNLYNGPAGIHLTNLTIP